MVNISPFFTGSGSQRINEKKVYSYKVDGTVLSCAGGFSSISSNGAYGYNSNITFSGSTVYFNIPVINSNDGDWWSYGFFL